MRGALTGSLALHLALMSLLFLVRPPRTISLPGAGAVKVALVDASTLAAPAPPPQAAPPAPPPDEQGVRLPDMKKPRVAKPAPEKAKTPPKPLPAKPSETPRPDTPGATTLTPARLGTSGLVGSMGVDSADFPFGYYLVLVRDRIASNWQPPGGLTSGQVVKAVVYFRITRDGRLASTRLETASAVDYFDRAAVRAVALSDPMPPLPAGFPGGDLGVHFGFEWEAP